MMDAFIVGLIIVSLAIAYMAYELVKFEPN